MADYMFPPGQVRVDELPPGLAPATMPSAIPPVETGVAQNPMPQVVSPTAPQDFDPVLAPADEQKLLKEEGAVSPSPTKEGFFDKLRSDPKLSQAMLMMGLRMMQGNKPGQDGMGMLGDAMMAAATAHNMLSYNEKEQARQAQELQMRKEESSARVKQMETSTVATKQGIDFRAELQPEELKEARLRVAKMRAEGAIQEARVMAEKIKNDPEWVRKQLDAGLRRDNSAAAANYASAASSSSLAAKQNQERQLRAILADPKASLEQKAAAEQALAGGRGGNTATMKNDLEMRARLLFQSGTVPSMEEARATVYKDSVAKKGGTSEDLRYLADNAEDPTVRQWALQELASGVGYAKGKGGGLPPGITEADIATTMAKHGLTREQVLSRLQKGK